MFCGVITLLKPRMHLGLTPTKPTGAISVIIPMRQQYFKKIIQKLAYKN